ncbi:unnamed protein product [Polarella glacialis]|uniref:Uncharacterized protein n=1 Tax=Polarella glacialis TaxID=89957 RepID=A0A813IJN4_POLGL|nr:unnamed protein product [Polarella glacialis]
MVSASLAVVLLALVLGAKATPELNCVSGGDSTPCSADLDVDDVHLAQLRTVRALARSPFSPGSVPAAAPKVPPAVPPCPDAPANMDELYLNGASALKSSKKCGAEGCACGPTQGFISVGGCAVCLR